MHHDRFYATALAIARETLLESRTHPEGPCTARDAARAVLQEAHSALSQAQFFAATDALGGSAAVLERLVRDLNA